ncbi:MAG TPA: protein kinase [Kribbella sp.]
MALEDIDGYSLRRGLGSGAAGSVWLLRDLGSGRHAVLKRISAAVVPAVEEFRRDLALTRSIDHPHLARLLDVRRTDREWLLISQHVAAGTLTRLLERREPLSLGELVTLISPLAQALAILHRAGLTHGNVTLDNVMFDAEGRPVLTDAGLRLLTAPEPAPAASDLAALAHIARTCGGDPRILTEDVFTGDGDEIAHRVLRLAAPEPINLGFGDDPPTSTPTPPPAGTTASSSAPTPSAEAPGHTAAVEASVHSARVEAISVAGPIGDARSAAGVPNAAIGAATPATGVGKSGGRTKQRAGSRKATGSRRTAGRANRSRSQNRSRRPIQRFRARLSPRSPAYAVLAVAGLASIIVLVFGLIAVGVLGGPSSSSASAADQPAASDATAPTAAILSSPTHTSAPVAASGNETTSPTSGASTAPSPPATPKDSTAPGDLSSPATPSAPGDPETTRWLRTLHALDAQRSRSFSTLDDAGLDAIYLPGSSPWKSDKSLLASYRDQHVRIEGLSIEIQSLAVEQSSPSTAVLRVVDRLISATAVDSAGRRTPLPPGQPTKRRVTLRTTPPATTWRIAEITIN